MFAGTPLEAVRDANVQDRVTIRIGQNVNEVILVSHHLSWHGVAPRDSSTSLGMTAKEVHPKFSISSSTSRRLSGEILPGPLCVPLYCHSSFCSNKRRSRSRPPVSSLNVSAAFSASTAFGSVPLLPEARAAFN